MTELISISPINYKPLGSVRVSSENEISREVKTAQSAKLLWKNLGLKKRINLLKKVYDTFEKNRDEIGELITKEIGMPISVRDLMEVGSGLDFFKWFLENTEKFLSPEITFEDETNKHTVYYEAIGVAVVISPWNFPFSNFIWGVIPNLIVGNPVLFKHSEECPLSGKLYEELISHTGLPEGVFTEIYGDGKVGDYLAHQDINLICFTGSFKIGKSLHKIASEKFIPIHLELGGSAPGIVFEDVDLEKVIETIYFARFYNSGQVCDGLKRLIVHESRFDEVINKLKAVIKNKRIGDPNDPLTDIGPLVAKRQKELLARQVKDSIKMGAKINCGGKSPGLMEGAFYLPTIVTNITPDMPVWQEEVFGPVLPVMSFKTEEDAVKLANNTIYGLGGYIFTEDRKRAEKVAKELETGMVGINNANYLNPANPWGGYKCSGLGRGNGRYGLRELCQLKIISQEK